MFFVFWAERSYPQKGVLSDCGRQLSGQILVFRAFLTSVFLHNFYFYSDSLRTPFPPGPSQDCPCSSRQVIQGGHQRGIEGQNNHSPKYQYLVYPLILYNIRERNGEGICCLAFCGNVSWVGFQLLARGSCQILHMAWSHQHFMRSMQTTAYQCM